MPNFHCSTHPLQSHPWLIWLCTGLLSLAHAQIPSQFTQADIDVYNRLVGIAVTKDSETITAQLAVSQAQLDESVLGKVGQSVVLNVSTSVSGSLSSFEQVSPNYSVSLGIDLFKLITPKTSILGAAQAKLDATTRAVGVNVMRAFTAYKVSQAQAQLAALLAENKTKQLEAATAQVKLGNGTPISLLDVQYSAQQAQLGIYSANATLLTAKLDLARACGVTLEELDKNLK